MAKPTKRDQGRATQQYGRCRWCGNPLKGRNEKYKCQICDKCMDIWEAEKQEEDAADDGTTPF